MIFNNRKFKRRAMGLNCAPSLPERIGTDVDCQNLQALLTGLGYRVSVKNDLPAKVRFDFSVILPRG